MDFGFYALLGFLALCAVAVVVLLVALPKQQAPNKPPFNPSHKPDYKAKKEGNFTVHRKAD